MIDMPKAKKHRTFFEDLEFESVRCVLAAMEAEDIHMTERQAALVSHAAFRGMAAAAARSLAMIGIDSDGWSS